MRPPSVVTLLVHYLYGVRKSFEKANIFARFLQVNDAAQPKVDSLMFDFGFAIEQQFAINRLLAIQVK